MPSPSPLLRSIALILISATLCSAEATAPAGTTPATAAKPTDGAQLPGLFQEEITTAITANDWPAALDQIDRYLEVVHRTAPVTTNIGSSYRDVRTLRGFQQQLSAAAQAYRRDGKSSSFRQAELDHLEKSAQEAGNLEDAAERFLPASDQEIEWIKDLLNDPDVGMEDPDPPRIHGQLAPIPVTDPNYRMAIRFALTVDPKQWVHFGGGYDGDFMLPLPAGNLTRISAIHVGFIGTTTPYIKEFVKEAPRTGATSAVTTKIPAP